MFGLQCLNIFFSLIWFNWLEMTRGWLWWELGYKAGWVWLRVGGSIGCFPETSNFEL